jgi:hypothetical protein
MSLIAVIIVVLVIAVIAYLIKQAPIDQLWKNVCYAILALFVIIWFLIQLQKAGVDIVI